MVFSIVYNGTVGLILLYSKIKLWKKEVMSLSSLDCLRKFTAIVQTSMQTTNERQNWEQEQTVYSHVVYALNCVCACVCVFIYLFIY